MMSLLPAADARPRCPRTPTLKHRSSKRATDQRAGHRCMGLLRATGAARWTKCVAVEPLAGAPGIEPGNGGIKIGGGTNEINAHSDCSCCVHVGQDQALSCAVGM